MMEASCRAKVAAILVFAFAAPAVAQDPAKAIHAEIKKIDEKIKEESERVARKKESLQAEFAALQRAETKAALKAKLAEIGSKHAAALKPSGADSKPVEPAVRAAIQEESKAAVGATVGRNLATIMEAAFASNLIALASGSTPVDYDVLVNDTILEVFDGPDFETNYRKMMPTFEKRLIELNGDLAAQKQKIADLDATAKARQLGAPPGMVHVPGGKYRIGSDAKEFEDIKKMLGFEPNAPVIDTYALGWPAHEVQIDDFFIDVNEVTHKYWAEFVRDTGRKAPKAWSQEEKKPPTIAGPNGAPADGAPETKPAADRPPASLENLPITSITIDDIEAYVEWCGRRLPSEFEWEAAARANSASDKSRRWFPWGDAYDRTKAFSNNQTAVTHPLRQGTQQLLPVGTFPQGRSALGINDLSGNAAEMTASYFTPYPNWKEDKAPVGKSGNPFSASVLVLRGGTALGSELYSLTTTRKGMNFQSAPMVGFRTALSKARGYDFFQRIAGGNLLAAALEPMGPPQKDEKSGRAELALSDPTRYTALMAGGFDVERQVPARARFIAMACRNTHEFTDPARVKAIAREHKKPVMLGYFRTDVDFVNPPIPKGGYWVAWDPGRVKGTGKDKMQLPEGMTLISLTNRQNVIDVPNVNPVLVARSTESTKLAVEKQGSVLSMILSFPVRDRKEARFIAEMRFEAAPEALSAYK